MAGFRGHQCGLDRLEVAHFADKDYVWILPQAAAKSLGKITRIDVHLTLRYERFLILVQEFDRVFDRDDVAVAFLVDMIDNCGERGRFTRAGRSGYKDEAASLVGNRSK